MRHPAVDAFLVDLSPTRWASDVWLYGSLATGDHRPGVSDIDLVTLTTRSLGGGSAAAARHQEGAFRSLPGWATTHGETRTARSRGTEPDVGAPRHTARMDAATLLTRLAEVIDAHDWDGLPALLHPSFTCRLEHTGEVFDRDEWVRLNADYPGFQRLVVEDLVADGDRGSYVPG